MTKGNKWPQFWRGRPHPYQSQDANTSNMQKGKGEQTLLSPLAPCLFSFPHPTLPIETLICLSSQNHEKNWGILIGYLKKGEGVRAALVVGEGGSNKGGGDYFCYSPVAACPSSVCSCSALWANCPHRSWVSVPPSRCHCSCEEGAQMN